MLRAEAGLVMTWCILRLLAYTGIKGRVNGFSGSYGPSRVLRSTFGACIDLSVLLSGTVSAREDLALASPIDGLGLPDLRLAA
jgi:hypothetical protein